MHAIVLAGGRGRRLGSLTENTQKAVLSFDGNPLIVHVIDLLLDEQSIDGVTVLTGYRGDDVEALLRYRYGKILDDQRLRVLHYQSVSGTLTRLVAALPELDLTKGHCICGVDSIIPQSVFHQFCQFTQRRRDNTILSLSPLISIAPTHKFACLAGNRLLGYVPFEQISDVDNQAWYVDVGIRYFPAHQMSGLLHFDCPKGTDTPVYIKWLLSIGEPVFGFVFGENWKHFAIEEDFHGSMPSAF